MSDPEALLKKIRKYDFNKICPNCGTQSPTFLGFGSICMKYKTFICDNCKTSHQAISHRCKSVSMSTWTMEEVQSLTAAKGGGNDVALQTWLANAPPFGSSYSGGQRPKQGDKIEVFKQFIVDCYERKLFFSDSYSTPSAQLNTSASPSPPAPIAPLVTKSSFAPAPASNSFDAFRDAPSQSQASVFDFDNSFGPPAVAVPPKVTHTSSFSASSDANGFGLPSGPTRSTTAPSSFSGFDAFDTPPVQSSPSHGAASRSATVAPQYAPPVAAVDLFAGNDLFASTSASSQTTPALAPQVGGYTAPSSGYGSQASGGGFGLAGVGQQPGGIVSSGGRGGMTPMGGVGMMPNSGMGMGMGMGYPAAGGMGNTGMMPNTGMGMGMGMGMGYPAAGGMGPMGTNASSSSAISSMTSMVQGPPQGVMMQQHSSFDFISSTVKTEAYGTNTPGNGMYGMNSGYQQQQRPPLSLAMQQQQPQQPYGNGMNVAMQQQPYGNGMRPNAMSGGMMRPNNASW